MAPLRVNKAWEAQKKDSEGVQREAVCEVTRELFIESVVLGRASRGSNRELGSGFNLHCLSCSKCIQMRMSAKLS